MNDNDDDVGGDGDGDGDGDGGKDAGKWERCTIGNPGRPSRLSSNF